MGIERNYGIVMELIGDERSLGNSHSSGFHYWNDVNKEFSKIQQVVKPADDGSALMVDNRPVRITNNYYSYAPFEYIESRNDMYNMLFKTPSNYWLASRYVMLTQNDVDYGMRYFDVLVRNEITGVSLYTSANEKHKEKAGVRPVVYLKSSVQLEKYGDMWEIQ